MTCIVAMRDGDSVIVGADACISTGDSVSVISDKKIFRRGDMVFGVCGTVRFLNVVKHVFKPPAFHGKSFPRYLSAEMLPLLQRTLIEGGCLATSKDDGTAYQDGNLLVIHDGKIYEVGHDFAVVDSGSEYAAIGSGGEIALGALHVLVATRRIHKLAVRSMLRKALEASAHHSGSVSPPFTFLTG